MTGHCAFSEGSTTDDGRKQAPDRCRQAVFNKLKLLIEACPIDRAQACPLRSFIHASQSPRLEPHGAASNAIGDQSRMQEQQAIRSPMVRGNDAVQEGGAA